MKDYERPFEEFWRPLVTDATGELDLDAIKRDLHPRPLRRVDRADLRPASSINQSFKFSFWELTLECGHIVERRCRYEPGGERGFGRLWHGRSEDEMLPPPERARCEACAREGRGTA